MKNILRLLLVPLVILAFAGAGFAQATPATPAKPASSAKTPEKKDEKQKASRVRGEITGLDAKAGTLKVKAKDKEYSLRAESNDAKSGLERVKVGDTVRVMYAEKDGKLIVRSMTKVRVKAETKATETKATQKPTETKEATKPAK